MTIIMIITYFHINNKKLLRCLTLWLYDVKTGKDVTKDVNQKTNNDDDAKRW